MTRWRSSVERCLWALGILCLGWAGATWLRAAAYQAEAHAALAGVVSSGAVGAEAVAAATRPLRPARGEPIGRLEIPRLGLSAVVAEGDDEATLGLAVGHLPDTPLPWESGNAALAGHRDTFFRPLRHIRKGDEIRLETAQGALSYRVTGYRTVEPTAVGVLDPAAGALTLITCYPFHFVGNAPRRFVVHAERTATVAG